MIFGSLLLSATSPAAAQTPEELRRQAEQRLGRQLSNQEIIQMLRQSGLSPEEIRSRLEQRGFEQSAADPWLAVLEGRASQVPEGTDPTPVVSALSGQQAAAGRRPPGEMEAARPERPPDAGPPIFGREIFRRATSEFRPVTTGPVPPDYRVGPGDQLVIVLTGAVEQAYELTVSREGWVVIPDVGRVFVNGKDMEALRETLFNRLSRSYASLTGPDPSTQFDVTLGSLRTNQVYVVGEVEEPGAYTVSSLATALNALYHAGGPTRNGSFRRIRVNRGGTAVRTLDLYDYLIRGRSDLDVRLQQGDIVFVPVAGKQVRIQGPVARPAIYELEEGDGLRDLIRYAGGVQPTAELKRVQIRRILPPEERAPGVHRAVLDVPVGDLDAEGEGIPLRDGDGVTVFAVLEETRNEVTVSGGVWRPGTYGATDSTRLWDVIAAAGGLLPDAYEGRAQIQRLREADQTRRLIPVSLATDSVHGPVENPRIEGMDQVFIYARRDLREDRAVSIGGWVKEPGVYPFADGMTVADLILKAGGLRTGAYLQTTQISRVVLSQARTDTLTRRFEVPLDSSYVFEGNGGNPGGQHSISGTEAARFELQNMDAVYVRKAPGFEPQRSVVVTGEIMFPGPYSIHTREERLSDVVERAGGLTPEAYAEGFQLWRSTRLERAREAGTDTAGAAEVARQALQADTMNMRTRRIRVGVDFVEAMQDPQSGANLLVEPGDSIYVPHFDPLVEVRGAVGVPTEVRYRQGAGVEYYIRQAGGYAENADRGRTRVRFANGEIDTRGGGFLFFGGGVKEPDPGSQVFVPEKPPKQPGGGLSTGQFLGFVTTIVSTTIIAIVR